MKKWVPSIYVLLFIFFYMFHTYFNTMRIYSTYSTGRPVMTLFLFLLIWCIGLLLIGTAEKGIGKLDSGHFLVSFSVTRLVSWTYSLISFVLVSSTICIPKTRIISTYKVFKDILSKSWPWKLNASSCPTRNHVCNMQIQPVKT